MFVFIEQLLMDFGQCVKKGQAANHLASCPKQTKCYDSNITCCLFRTDYKVVVVCTSFYMEGYANAYAYYAYAGPSLAGGALGA